MKNLKIIAGHILVPFLLAILLVAGLLCYVILFPKDAFHGSYQSVIQDKYENLINTAGPKIIIIGGSSAGFGINEELLSELTGYPIVNLGLHAGFGGRFNTEISKANIGKGDIVLLAYEYGWPDENYFTEFGTDLVMSGIDSKYEMYRYVPISELPKMIGYLPEYCKQKANFPQEIDGTCYSRKAFDDNGCMHYDRAFIYEDYNPETGWAIDLKDIQISNNSAEYLREYKKYVEQKGAVLYFTVPPLYEKAKLSADESFTSLVKAEEDLIGIPYISNPLDYIYKKEYMYDTIYHCSNLGEEKRTKQLAEDLQPILDCN